MTIRKIEGNEYGEAKEAVAAALLQRVYRELSGEGGYGAFVFGEKPSRRFTTAFLMPLRDQSGLENVTDNLNIPIQGLDVQLHRGVAGTMTVSASYSIYIRVLPEWDDLCDRRFGMEPRFMLRTEVKQSIDAQVNARFPMAWERACESPPVGRPSRRAVREQVFREVSAEFGVPDLAVSHDSEEDSEEQGEGGALPYRVTGGNIPAALVSSAPLPMKWRRFSTAPDIFAIVPSIGSQEDFARAADKLSSELRSSVIDQVTAWLATPEGLSTAYRPVRITPADVVNLLAWNSFLARTRAIMPELGQLLPPGIGDVNVAIRKHPDFGLSNVDNVRVLLENGAMELTRAQVKKFEQCIHQIALKVTLTSGLHHRLRLQRIKPSYRFRDFFSYGALGVNCGVNEGKGEDGTVILATTCLPKYQQPKLEARAVPGLDITFKHLSDEGQDLAPLYGITAEYRSWVARQQNIDPSVHLTDPVHQQAERVVFQKDLAAYDREIVMIETGINLLESSQVAYRSDPGSPQGMPYQAWLLLNRTMASAWDVPEAGWRLFQLTFILSHLPGLVSRCSEFAGYFDQERDEETATLLYFPTGGGKSEAFYGLLVFNLFFDRMRGKHTGVTALIRYPLRLLTIQQAQRLFRLLARAEVVRLDAGVGGDPFAIGFWVGSTNTPNKNDARELVGVNLPPSAPDPQQGTPDYDEYRNANISYNKVRECPYCKGPTGLRRGDDAQRRVLIVCRDDACPWNLRHGGHYPLPFLITDEDIYGFAPPVVLGTIDKLALIGQHDSTINKIVGMLGLARYRDHHDRLLMPRTQKALTNAIATATPVAPACQDGEEVFSDPFPSLIIQDEAHLLEESLGTFAGLFETAFDQLLEGLAPLLGERVARRPDGRPRLPKVIAATATISSPERQIETLYQRRVTRFPYPGTSLYESFYTVPMAPFSVARGSLLLNDDPRRPEVVSPVMRTYASLITNGRVYAVATATALATYHSVITRCWRMAAAHDAELLKELVGDLPDSPLVQYWEKALFSLDMDTLHSILDLYRIALVYVNSKRGGDQVLDAITEASAKGHRMFGEPLRQLRTELISGGVDIAAIQKVMAEALKPVIGNDLQGSLREIVATSAISHGVDLDMFNAMFFVGAPNDISELIQASSRVGRTHVGFSVLLPTPQSRRDRYIVEVHDIFHRFLEQMVSPAAIERWAENAIHRVMPSIFQLWLNGVKEQELFMQAPDKSATPALDKLYSIQSLYRGMGPSFLEELTDFAKRAIAIQGRGDAGVGRPGNMSYYDAKVDELLRDITREIMTRKSVGDLLSDYWGASVVQRRPMTSLRDIDEAGLIVTGKYLPDSGFRQPRVPDAILQATKAVRSQAADSSDLDNDSQEVRP